MYSTIGLKEEKKLGNTLEQDIRMKVFELRNSDKRQYLDDYDKGVIAGKEAIYEEWLVSLNKEKTNQM